MTAHTELLPVYLIHWNAPDWCASSARSLLRSEGLTIELTVVDNGQRGGPSLEDALPKGVRLLRATSNLGYSGGANLALEDWLRRLPTSQLCLIGSHDLHVRGDALKKLVDAATEEKTFGILAPALLSPYQFSGGFWTRWREGPVSLDGVRGTVERDWVPGSCMLIRQQCVESVQGFDEAYGSYVEDVDLALRARDAGWKVGVVADAISWGLGSASPHAEATMLANRVLLLAKRGELVSGTLRGLASLASLGVRAVGALGRTLAIGANPEERAENRARLAAETKAMQRIGAALGAMWIGRNSGPTHSRKTYQETLSRPAMMTSSRFVRPPQKGTRGPVASIVITTRDRPESVSRAVGSALSQTIRDIEVVVVDQGSTKPFRVPQRDDRVRVIRLEGLSSVCAARNRGIDVAKGEWVAFLDEDDQLFPQMLETSLRAASESRLPPPVAALSAIEVVGPIGQVIEVRAPVTVRRGKPYLGENGDGGFRPTNTLVAPVGVLRAIGGWDEEINPLVHDDLFLRLREACSIQGVHQLTYRMKAQGERQGAQDYLARAEGIARTLLKHEAAFDAHPRARARLEGEMGKNYLKAGRWLPAAVSATRALFDDPRRPYAFRQWVGSLAGPRISSWYLRTVTGSKLANR